MRSVHESDVTEPVAPDAAGAGVWTLSGRELIIAEPDGPATVLVPTEQVLLLGVDLPLPSRARRLEALPFAVEDRIAEPVESVHLALGAEIAPKQYLVGVVRHDVMAAWVEQAEAAGLGHAAVVPDALALPVPPEGCWSVDLGATRAVVRAGDGTGFACSAPMLRAAWEAAERPPAIAYGAALPADMLMSGAPLEPQPLARRLASPPLDLRQGAYARSRRVGNVWRRIAWIVALGAAAHAAIAVADTVMLRVIADRRAAETRALVATMAPGVPQDANFAGAVANMLPTGSGPVPQAFFPLLSRVSGALTPLGAALDVRAIKFEANTLTFDLAGRLGLAAQLKSALAAGGVKAGVAESPDGSIRVTASPS